MIQPTMFTKTAILATLCASASAFAPASFTGKYASNVCSKGWNMTVCDIQS